MRLPRQARMAGHGRSLDRSRRRIRCDGSSTVARLCPWIEGSCPLAAVSWRARTRSAATSEPSGCGRGFSGKESERELHQRTRSAIGAVGQSAIAQRVGQQRFHVWFNNSTRLDLKQDGLEIAVPNDFISEWIGSHFSQPIQEAAHEVLGCSLRCGSAWCRNCSRSRRRTREPGDAAPPAIEAEGFGQSSARGRCGACSPLDWPAVAGDAAQGVATRDAGGRRSHRKRRRCLAGLTERWPPRRRR